jgi:catechol 2,3-dioxygenase
MIGLTAAEREDGALALGAAGGPPLVVLHGDSRAPKLDRRATGLYHQAILVPERRDLAIALARLAAARWPLDGASDHLVSEALYLSDPDGNGIEIYRDRPREQWPRDGETIEMATLPLDLENLIGEIGGPQDVSARMPAGTTIGHVHLQVAELSEIEAFYGGILGLDVTVRLYQQALFMSAGGYHHHLGLNTWQSRGGSSPAPGSVGLRHYELRLGDGDDLGRILSRASAAGYPVEDSGDASTPQLRDPSGNAVRLVLPNP